MAEASLSHLVVILESLGVLRSTLYKWVTAKSR